MAINRSGTLTTSHNAITGTATSAAIDCRGYTDLWCGVTLSTTGTWTISLTASNTLAGTYYDLTGQSVTLTATGAHVFHGVPDWVKVVATEDSGSAACTVVTMPVSVGGSGGAEINLDTSGNVQVEGAVDAAIYVDDADWTDSASSHILVGGLYQSVPQTVTDGDVAPLAINSTSSLRVYDANVAPVAAAAYVDDADWTDGTSRHMLVGGLYGSNTITSGDVGPLMLDASGNLKVTGIPFRDVTTWSVANSAAAAQTNVSLQASPGGALCLYVDWVVISNGATAGEVKLLDGSGGTVMFAIEPGISGGCAMTFDPPIKLTAATALCVTSTTVTDHRVNVGGHTA